MHFEHSLATLFLLVSVIAVGTVRVAIWLSHKFDILDRPDPRKAHREPVAYLGGLGMLLAILAGLVLWAYLMPTFAVVQRNLGIKLACGAVAIWTVGFFDDIRPIPALIKLFLQVAVAGAMWAMGVRIGILSFVGEGNVSLGLAVSAIVTVGWYITLMNSINLVDGLDGLAGGISFLGALSLVGVCFVIDRSVEVELGAALSAITAAAALGFLAFNWHPAKVFMGDGGSLLLGYMLASASLVGSTKTSTLLALCVPLAALGLPLFETYFSFLRRAIKKQSPFKPDRRHLHHRLLDVGLDQRRVVVVLLYFTGFLGLNSVILAKVKSSLMLMNVVFIVGGLILLIENLKYLERKRDGK